MCGGDPDLGMYNVDIVSFSPRMWLRISHLTGKTGLVDRQDMGSIPVVLNI